MKNRTIALILIPVLLFSSVSLALSFSSRFMSGAQEHSSIPPEAFTNLAAKKAVGFGDWKLSQSSPNLTIFEYPAGTSYHFGWWGYYSCMLIVVTVQIDAMTVPAYVDMEVVYLIIEYPDYIEHEMNTTRRIGGIAPSSTSFAVPAIRITLRLVTPTTAEVTGHYFAFIDRRV